MTGVDYGKLENKNAKYLLLLTAEVSFKSESSGFVRSLNTKRMVYMLLKNADVLSNFRTICCDVPDVTKEVTLNLLRAYVDIKKCNNNSYQGLLS